MECLDSIRRYHTDTPTFLHNRPRPFVDHCLKRLPPAASVSDAIQHVHNGTFLVPSVASSGTYAVQLQSSSGVPSCTCPDWLKYRLPCKHMLAVFSTYPAWGWDSLPAAYRNFPHFSLDPSILCRPLESDATLHDDGGSGSAHSVADASLIQQSPSALEPDGDSDSGRSDAVSSQNEPSTAAPESDRDSDSVHSDTLKLQSRLRQLLMTACSYTYSVSDGSVLSEAISAAKAVFNTLKAAVPRLSQQRPNARRRFGKCNADASCLRRWLHAYRLKRALKKKRQKAGSSDISIFQVTIKFHVCIISFCISDTTVSF